MWICVYCNEINETKQKQCCFCNCKRKKEDNKGKRGKIIVATAVAVVVLGLTTTFLATHGSREPMDGATESMQNKTQTAVAGIQTDSLLGASSNAVEQQAVNMQPSPSIPTASITPFVSVTVTVPVPVSRTRQNEAKQTTPPISNESVTSSGNSRTIPNEIYSASGYSNSTESEYVEMDMPEDYEGAMYADDPYELF